MLDLSQLAGCLLEDGTHILHLRVYHEDTDFSGFVYHGSYVRFCERGRSDYVRLLGISQNDLSSGDEPGFFVVRRMSMDFLKPARFDDILEVRTRKKEVRGASLILDQSILRRSQELFKAQVQVVLVSRQGKPLRMGALVRN